MKHILAVLLLLVAVSFCTNFSPAKVHLLDYRFDPSHPSPNRINALFRTNLPLKNGVFMDHNALVTAMKDAALQEATLLLPETTPYLVDYSLLRSDDPNLQVEKDFFLENPSLGEVRSHPILGTSKIPSSYSPETLKQKSEDLSWIEDDIPGVVEELKRLLNDFSGSQNLYIFVHCQHGKDRAGEVSGAYWLSERYRTWEQVSASNWEIANYKHLTFANQRALTWYCHHLQLHKNYTHLTCTHENLDSQSVQEPPLVGWDVEQSIVTVQDADKNSKPDLWYLIVFPSLVGVQGVIICSLLLSLLFLGVKYRRSTRQISLEERESNLNDVRINFDPSLENELTV